jgi:hypothetical protein
MLPRPLPALPCPSLALGRLRGLMPCTASESKSGLPRSARGTDRVRTPLYPGGCHACVGRPLKPAAPDPHPMLGLEPLSRFSSARVTMRNTEA